MELCKHAVQIGSPQKIFVLASSNARTHSRYVRLLLGVIKIKRALRCSLYFYHLSGFQALQARSTDRISSNLPRACKLECASAFEVRSTSPRGHKQTMIAHAGKLWVMGCFASLWLASPSWRLQGQSYHNVCDSKLITHHSKRKSRKKRALYEILFPHCSLFCFYSRFHICLTNTSGYTLGF